MTSASSISEHIRVVLSDEISTGVIKPGSVLDEGTLSSRFSASRTPVREALRQLEASGLVEIRPRKGAFVLPLTLPRLMQMFEVTAEMEAMCVGLATHRITGVERAELFHIHEKASAAATDENFDHYDELNLAFHELLYRGAHNDFLFEELMRLRARLLPFRRTQLRYPERLRSSNREHEAIIRAIMQGDATQASLMMREHMLNAGVALALFMQTSGETEHGYSSD
ncbi:putative GntR family transcriptional regulator [Agrobacterium rubi TR3 = NBRC 13261]|uniref:Putative GntR family transcriptional regulator n=1 Tax=Agrobacterium rubi TR3 = NBRC 13261 TaxID=1368415 RepID=A0A081D1T9_9HYPH|nr:GntR family transcriptional regulator [Agrobacterium rubi]MBP1880913.1 DNA-binding GntR family transcriptional regulator [Agrobacterium rubi]GAK72885.1 putative GntR family transcriptional regulator [Agrobacterium rubi TR3 = NBRC 13261]